MYVCPFSNFTRMLCLYRYVVGRFGTLKAANTMSLAEAILLVYTIFLCILIFSLLDDISHTVGNVLSLWLSYCYCVLKIFLKRVLQKEGRQKNHGMAMSGHIGSRRTVHSSDLWPDTSDGCTVDKHTIIEQLWQLNVQLDMSLSVEISTQISRSHDYHESSATSLETNKTSLNNIQSLYR